MAKRIGANKRKKNIESRRNIGGAVSKAVSKGLSLTKILIVVALVGAAAVFGAIKLIGLLRTSPMFTVATIRIEGTMRVDKTEALKNSGIKQGMRMMDIHPAVSQKAIARNRWVKTVDVSRHFPNTVVICVHEREPVALVCAGGVYYMDKDGTLLPLFDKTYSNLPVVTGMLDVRFDSFMCVGTQACTRIKAFFEAAKNEDVAFAKRLSQVDFMANRMIRLRMEDMPTTIELTDANAPVVLHRLRQLVENVQNRPDALPHSINLCYANMAYVR